MIFPRCMDDDDGFDRYDERDDIDRNVRYEMVTCSSCSGSGEGMYDGSRCSSCRGSGVDYEAADPDPCDED